MTADAARRLGAGAGGTLQTNGFFAFRVPALPMALVTSWAEDGRADDRPLLRRRLHELVDRADVQNALAIASPDLLDAARRRGEDPGVEAALVRYVSRMSTRPTPYGLFAACGVGLIDDHTRIDLPDPMTWRVHSQLDADYLDALVRDRAAKLRRRLTFRPNQSLHLQGGRWRYVESRLDGLERKYHLVQIRDSKHLQRALDAARDTASQADVVAAVAGEGVDVERATRFVEELIDAQVLVPTLAIAITGDPPLDSLIADLDRLGDDDVSALLAGVRHELSVLDAKDGGEPGARYQAIAARLEKLGLPLDRSRLFHVQMTVPACDAVLGRLVVEDVIRGLELLRRMAPVRPRTELDAFRDAFLERYDAQEVPLLDALDEELGVGFGAEAGRPDPAPLLDSLRFPGRSHVEASLGGREARLLELLHRAWSQDLDEVVLTSDDVAALSNDDIAPWPNAVGATAVLARTREGLRVVVPSATGPSGARLLGRFCHSDAELEGHVRAHLRAEEELDPEAVHAEIVHLPSGRLVNVLARPVLRQHELEWLGRSGTPREKVIEAADLMLSIRDGRFVLRSRSLGRQVLPRLTSAHNYNRHSPGVYRFLAAVQSEGVAENVAWSWFPFERAPSTPRVRRGPIVLALARWRVGRQELKALGPIRDWRERRRLPRWICLVEHDNVLPFDLDNAVSVDAFVRTVRSRDEVLLEELYPGPDELVASAPDGKRALEVVIPLVRTAPVRAGAAPQIPTVPAPAVRRTLPPGSEWTYLKLYTGSASADVVLRDNVRPCVRRLIAAGAADLWFFLRYEDPEFHLRLRAHGQPDHVRPAFEALAAQAIDAGLVHDAALGTYRREIERYGGPDGIGVAERLFQIDSEAVLDLLGLFAPGPAGLDARWRLGVLGAHRLFTDLGVDATARMELARRAQAAFEQEFKADGRLRKDVAAKVRAERAAIDHLLDASADDAHPLAPGIAVLDARSVRLAPLSSELRRLRQEGRLTQSLEGLSGSFVHMWLNRLSRSDARRQEYVTYALLARVYEARSHR